MRELRLKVEGMKCGGCETRIKNALSALEGVEKAEANHRNKTVTVWAGESVSFVQIKEKIDDLGFEVVE